MLTTEEQKETLKKLRSIMNLVVEECESNLSFANKVNQVLSLSTLKSPKKIKEPAFNHITFLQEKGAHELRQHLSSVVPTQELIGIAKYNKMLKNNKDLAKKTREELVEIIIEHADKKLNLGSTFLRN